MGNCKDVVLYCCYSALCLECVVIVYACIIVVRMLCNNCARDYVCIVVVQRSIL